MEFARTTASILLNEIIELENKHGLITKDSVM